MMKQPSILQREFKKFLDSPPLTRVQFAIGAAALLWVLPVLLLIALQWDAVSSWMGGAKRAEWAAAIGSIAAAWAAVWAAVYPQRLRRAEEKLDGAAEASAHRNAVGMVQADLVGLVDSYKITMERLDAAFPAMVHAREVAEVAEQSLSNNRFTAKQNKEVAEAEFEKWRSNRQRIGEKLRDSLLRLETVPTPILRRYDFAMASSLSQAVNQLHAAKGIFDKGFAASALEIPVNSTIAAINRFLQRVDRADEFVLKASVKQERKG